MAVDERSPKEASNIFHSIMTASVTLPKKEKKTGLNLRLKNKPDVE